MPEDPTPTETPSEVWTPTEDDAKALAAWAARVGMNKDELTEGVREELPAALVRHLAGQVVVSGKVPEPPAKRRYGAWGR